MEVDKKTDHAHNSLQTNMTTLPFLEWLHNQFGVLSSTVCYARTPEKGAEYNRLHGFGGSCKAENYRHVYRWSTKTHPFLNDYLNRWYGCEGEKKFPNDVELSPITLLVWYVCDGGLHFVDDYNHFRSVALSNICQNHRFDYLEGLFSDIGLGIYTDGSHIHINREDTDQFFNHIGSPPTDFDAGFKYKWQYQDSSEYRRLKNIHDSQPYQDEDEGL